MRARPSMLVAVILVAASCGQASTPSSPSPSPTPTGSTVSIVAGASTKTTTAYNPNPVVVTRGGMVTWMNNDTVTHTSTSDTGSWSSGAIAPGGSYSYTFTSSGTFAYHCTIHPGMIAVVNVQ